jgi:alpha-methylacyl-CoA racemase
MNTPVLHGIRILDFSTNLPGPFGTQILADLGADVIMVEPPSGEPARSKSAGLFYAGHRNKRSIILDLKSEQGVEAALRLAATSDVFVESFRPGVMERLGLGYAAIEARRPRVVYCSITGYGQVGPRRSAPGHDINYLAAAGALSFSGHWGRPPARSGLPVADLTTSLYLTIAILTALRSVENGDGSVHIDLSMTDAAMALASSRAGIRLTETYSNQDDKWPTNDLFSTADGELLAVGAIEEHLWQNLRGVLGSVDQGVLDPRFDDEPGRRRHGDDLYALLTRIFLSRTADDWDALLDGCDTAVTRVVSVDEASHNETAKLRHIVQEAGGVRHVMQPFLWNGQQPAQLRHAGPRLGEHTAEILAELFG